MLDAFNFSQIIIYLVIIIGVFGILVQVTILLSRKAVREARSKKEAERKHQKEILSNFLSRKEELEKITAKLDNINSEFIRISNSIVKEAPQLSKKLEVTQKEVTNILHENSKLSCSLQDKSIFLRVNEDVLNDEFIAKVKKCSNDIDTILENHKKNLNIIVDALKDINEENRK